MKFPLPCAQCIQESPHRGFPSGFGTYNDDGRFDLVCDYGHRSLTVLQLQKFEILFDIGGHAIIDGYYREAVSSFTSSLERVYEFFIKTIYFDKKQNDQFNSFWDMARKSSERQLGAFVALYSFETGAMPKILSEKQSNFRNKVVHQGKIPSKEEAISYGQSILDIIRPIIKLCKEKYKDGLNSAISDHLRDLSEGNKYPQTNMGMMTIVSLRYDDAAMEARTMVEALDFLESMRWVTNTMSGPNGP